MSNTIKPSTNLLPMADIAEELRLKYEFSTRNDLAKDTQRVKGINSDLIAVAAIDGDGNLIEDRETVKNALNLGGKGAEDFITKEESTKLENFSNNIAQVYADEIKHLRDEMYQIRGQLARQGLITEYALYEGFQDFFRISSPKYLNQPICGILQDAMGAGVSVIYPEAPTEFSVGDWFVIHKESDILNNNQETSHLVKVTAKDETLGELTFVPALTDLAKDNVKLYKALGQYNKGGYSFSKIEKDAIIDKEKYTMLNDDTNIEPLVINESKTGYAVSFKVPTTVKGALTKFSVMALSEGSPGSLMCYVIAEDSISRFRNIAEAQEAGELVAISKPIMPLQAITYSKIDFEFQNPYTGSTPILDDKKYCFVIEALTANKSGDQWRLQFSYHKSTSGTAVDLQKNNITYKYKEIPTSELDPSKAALTVDTVVSNYDMYFILTTNEVAPEYETAFNQGLYTAQFKLPNPIEVSRARLALRINREGNYVVTSSPGAYHDGNNLTVGIEPGVGSYNMTYGTGIRTGDKIAINNDLRNVFSVNNNTMAIEKGAYIEEKARLYRLGYEVYLRAYKTELNPVTNTYIRKNAQRIQLPIIGILPDGTRLSPNISDRVIFEGELNRDENDIPIYANEFEIQIVWNSNFSSEDMTTHKDLIGKIYDLYLSFDKSL